MNDSCSQPLCCGAWLEPPVARSRPLSTPRSVVSIHLIATTWWSAISLRPPIRFSSCPLTKRSSGTTIEHSIPISVDAICSNTTAKRMQPLSGPDTSLLMKPPVDHIRISSKGREILTKLKKRTGIINWNQLCRLALCRSLNLATKPLLPAPLDTAIEIDWKTFAGPYDSVFAALLPIAQAGTALGSIHPRSLPLCPRAPGTWYIDDEQHQIAWGCGGTTSPYLAQKSDIRGVHSRSFVRLLRAQVAADYRLHPDGKVLFPFRRTFVIAYR